MSALSIGGPFDQLQKLRSGHPLDSPESMAMLNLDRAFLYRVSGWTEKFRSAEAAEGSAWVIGGRGCGKTQTLLVLRQMFSARAMKEENRG